MNDREVALIDNDFIQQLAYLDYEDEKWIKMVGAVFEGVGCIAGIHGLVYLNEMMDDSSPEKVRGRIEILLNNNIVSIKKLDEIEKNLLKKKYYEMVFKEICKEFHGEVLCLDIFHGWKKKSSLGEIHSLTLCATAGYGIFLSDDHGSRKIARIVNARFVPGESEIKVYSRKTALEVVQQKKIVNIPKHSVSI